MPALRCLLLTALLAGGPAFAGDCGSWPAWQRFMQLYVSEDGRVIDAGVPRQITVSEGQAYALMFALIGNDGAAFSKILRWTQDNLARGSLERSLPAWKWGRADDGAWTVLDANSAADADVWMAYALIEAGALWRNASYAALGKSLAQRILREEVALVPGLGMTLLPSPKGFVANQTWRLNPSYAPIEALRGLRSASGNRQWDEVIKSSAQVILASAPHGFAADWIAYRQPAGFITDALSRGVGSYDAIRVYLWAGMLPSRDPLAGTLARKLAPMEALSRTLPAPFESIDTGTLEVAGKGQPGFSAALLPLLTRAKDEGTARAYRERAQDESLRGNQHYYSDSLSLWGLGWVDGRYGFDPSGELWVSWTASCRAR
jgi:endoglucanase